MSETIFLARSALSVMIARSGQTHTHREAESGSSRLEAREQMVGCLQEKDLKPTTDRF